MNRFRINIDSNLGGLFVISILVHGVCEHLGVNPEEAASLELCTVEAVTNAIKHAYGDTPGHEVSIELLLNNERLDVAVFDQGQSIPKEHLAKLSESSRVFEFDPSDLGAIPEGGMGLEIIRQEMDEVSYSTDNGTNCLRMTKFLSPAQSAQAPV